MNCTLVESKKLGWGSKMHVFTKLSGRFFLNYINPFVPWSANSSNGRLVVVLNRRVHKSLV